MHFSFELSELQHTIRQRASRYPNYCLGKIRTAVSQYTSIVILIFFSVKNIETTPFNLYSFDSPNHVLIHFQTRTDPPEQWAFTFFLRKPERSLENRIRLHIQTKISPQAFCVISEIFGALRSYF